MPSKILGTPLDIFSLERFKVRCNGLTVISSPAFWTGHDHNITGTKEDGDGFHIASCSTEQEDRGTSNTVAISG